MGQLIENYTRDELRRVALPGKSISTLFWVLPIGRWPRQKLDRWWQLFTQGNGVCHEHGLLLVRDATNRHPSEFRADLAAPATSANAGNLLDLVPELGGHPQEWHDSTARYPALLVLSGAYPQPGWGVVLSWPRHGEDPHDFERLLSQVIDQSCSPIELEAIRIAASTHRHKTAVERARPSRPQEPPDFKEVLKARECLNELFDAFRICSAEKLQSLVDRAQQLRLDALLGNAAPTPEVWSKLRGAIQLPGKLAGFLRDTQIDWAELVRRHDAVPKSDHPEFLKSLSPRENSFLKQWRFIHGQFPTLTLDAWPQWVETHYPAYLATKFDETLGAVRQLVEARAAAMEIHLQTDRQNYERRLQAWHSDVQTAEAAYRSSLAAATTAQWNLGTPLLMALEQMARANGFEAKSVPWDPPRMVGWKLHQSCPDIQGSDLIVAARTVLTPANEQAELAIPKGTFNGSLFADYAYYVAMMARKMTPWQATQQLLMALLGAGQLRRLLGDAEASSRQGLLFGNNDISRELLNHWGWPEPASDQPRPLIGCVGQTSDGQPVLVKGLNESRTSLESCLKDLVRITLNTLGWQDHELDAKITIHCGSYRKTPGRTWKDELRRLTAGGALIMLESLLPLAFPEHFDGTAAKSFRQQADRLREVFNAGSHDPPPPLPSHEQLCQYGRDVVDWLTCIHETVGELPWHLAPAQVFGSEPAVATGHAWSHSHPEERLIRVMLWAGHQARPEMLVWNRTQTNPVMTEAVIL